ncbi:MAG TPA: hypothetical protein VK453_10610 [Micromonosporaceae bacterium]|nr:hypothetical protein [Micromonosporaceae bacterium]
MQRARRTAVLAVLTLAGVLALTGCRSEPGVAIYIGDTRYSQERVDGLANQFTDVVGAPPATSRQQVVSWIVASEVGKRMAAEEKWQTPPVDLAAASQQFEQVLLRQAGVDPAAVAQGQQVDPALTKEVAEKVQALRPLVELYAQSVTYGQLVQERATPAQPTEADYADLYERAKAAGATKPGQTLAEYRQDFGEQNEQLFAATIGMRNMYVEAIKRANVAVNPRYGPAELALLSNGPDRPLVVVPLDAKGNSAPVRNG